MKRTAMKQQIARSVLWIVSSRVGVQSVSLLFTLLIARLLHPADYGLVALAGFFTNTLATIAELGLGAAIVQFRDPDRAELNTIFWLTALNASLGYLALYVSAPTIASWFGNPVLSDVIRAIGLGLPLVCLHTVPDGLLRKRLQLDKVSQAEIAAALVSFPIVFALAWAGAGVWALVAGILVLPSVQGAAMFWLAQWRPGRAMSGRRLREILRYSLALIGARVSWVVYQRADTLILGKAAGPVVLGFYSMAMNLATLPVEKVSTVVNQLAFPIMAEFQADRNALRASLLKGLRIVAWVSFPMCAGLVLVAHDLVDTVLSAKWTPIVPIIYLLSAYAFVRSVSALLPPVLLARYRTRSLLAYNVTLLAILLPAFALGALWGGALGVAGAWVLVYPLVTIWLAREVLSEIDITWADLWDQLWPPLAATAMMIPVVVSVQFGISAMDGGALARLALAIPLGVLTYVAALLLFGKTVRTEIREFAQALSLPRRKRPLPVPMQDPLL